MIREQRWNTVSAPTVTAIHALKVERYTVARSAAAIGLYPREARAETVALRLDSCSAG